MKNTIRACYLTTFLFLAGASVFGQSIDLNSPTPVRTTEVVGRIDARDLGDARLTNHYYAFTGTPGDVLITIQSSNLNGDADVFTAGTLRPLLKFALYAERTTPTTKGIYLRRREDLILRIEARSPNDDEGIYQLRFGGSFEPVIGGPEISENQAPSGTAAVPTSGKKTRRVSSVGARIEEPTTPVGEVAVAPTSEPTPAASPATEPPLERPAGTEPGRPATAKNSRSTRRPTGRRAPSSRKPSPPVADKQVSETEPAKTAEPTEAETTSKTSSRSGARRGAVKSKAAKPPPEPVDESGPRLIIETSGGTLINRPMSGVRRVTVENGRVLVVGNDGKIDRFLLADVVRMTIQP